MTAQKKSMITEEFARHVESGLKQDTSTTYNEVLQLRDDIWTYISSELDFEEDFGCKDIESFSNLSGEHLGRMRNFTGASSSAARKLTTSWSYCKSLRAQPKGQGFEGEPLRCMSLRVLRQSRVSAAPKDARRPGECCTP